MSRKSRSCGAVVSASEMTKSGSFASAMYGAPMMASMPWVSRSWAFQPMVLKASVKPMALPLDTVPRDSASMVERLVASMSRLPSSPDASPSSACTVLPLM